MNDFDVIIIGGGPIGIACGVEAQKRGLSYLIIEKGAIVNYGECYVRKYVDIDLNQLKNDLVNYHHQFFLFSSTNSAKNFIHQLSNVDSRWLQNIKIIVIQPKR